MRASPNQLCAWTWWLNVGERVFSSSDFSALCCTHEPQLVHIAPGVYVKLRGGTLNKVQHEGKKAGQLFEPVSDVWRLAHCKDCKCAKHKAAKRQHLVASCLVLVWVVCSGAPNAHL